MLSPVISYQVNGKYWFEGQKKTLYSQESSNNRFESCHERSFLGLRLERGRLFSKGRAFGFQKVSITVETNMGYFNGIAEY